MRALLASATAALTLVGLLAGCSGEGGGPVEVPAGQVILRGVVVTAAIVPVPNATVTAEPGGAQAVTDAGGAFSLGPLDLGAYSLAVRAQGYATERLAVDVVADDGRLVNVVLQAVASDVPYHELLHFEAFVECTYAQRFGPLGGDFSCFGLTDLVLGIKVDNDRNHFPFHVNAGGFKGLLFEMVWDPQPTGPTFAGFIRSAVPVGEVGGFGFEHQYWVDSGESPLRAWVLAGVENDGAYDGDVFHPDPEVAADYEVLVGGVTSGAQPAEVAVTFNQVLDVFVTLFYNELGGESYSALAPF